MKATTKDVTDPRMDAPDGAVVDGWKRIGLKWKKLPVTLVERQHPDRTQGWKSYRVFLRGREVGCVERYREETYRKHGRIRYGVRIMRSPRWVYRVPGTGAGIGLSYGTRKDALDMLLDHVERAL